MKLGRRGQACSTAIERMCRWRLWKPCWSQNPNHTTSWCRLGRVKLSNDAQQHITTYFSKELRPSTILSFQLTLLHSEGFAAFYSSEFAISPVMTLLTLNAAFSRKRPLRTRPGRSILRKLLLREYSASRVWNTFLIPKALACFVFNHLAYEIRRLQPTRLWLQTRFWLWHIWNCQNENLHWKLTTKLE